MTSLVPLLLAGCGDAPVEEGEDCTGMGYVDADGDGWGTGEPLDACEEGSGGLAERPGDCDDADPARHPGAIEVCDEGVDQDCDGQPLPCLQAGVWVVDDIAVADVLAEAADDRFGIDLTGLPDFDGDGYEDLIVGALFNDRAGSEAGAAWLFAGPFSASFSLDDAILTVTGETAGDRLGKEVARLGDVDGDGRSDIAVGAYRSSRGAITGGKDPSDVWQGAVAVFLAPREGSVTLGDADAIFEGTERYLEGGWSVNHVGDLDGDGLADLALGAHEPTEGGVGHVYAQYGPLSGTTVFDEMDVVIDGSEAAIHLGTSVVGAGDVDGDGLADLAAGARGGGGDQRGLVVVFLGPLPARATDLDADVRMVGEAPGDWAGWSVAPAGDVDGDGLDDLLVGARGVEKSTTSPGKAHLVSGPLAIADLAEATATIDGGGIGWEFGQAADGVGDVDGDGLEDIVVGSDMESSVDDRNGAAYVYLAPLEGRLGVEDAWFTVLGGSWQSHLGVMVDGGTDLDGDGRPDLALGAHRDATIGEAAGRAWIVSLWEP